MVLLTSSLIRSKLLLRPYNIGSYFGKLQVKRLSEKVQENVKKEENVSANDLLRPLRRQIEPTNFQKRVLVWTKIYKSMEDVPNRVSLEQMDKANNKGRIKTCNYMIVAVIIGCFINAYLGRKASQRGESLHSMNMQWHEEINKREMEKKTQS